MVQTRFKGRGSYSKLFGEKWEKRCCLIRIRSNGLGKSFQKPLQHTIITMVFEESKIAVKITWSQASYKNWRSCIVNRASFKRI